MKKKYYAVREGREKGIFDTWSECENRVKGFAGAEFKSFPTLEEAKEYLCKKDVKEELVQSEVYAYVDGSFNDKAKITGGGGVLYWNGEEFPFALKTIQKELTEMRNVGGEILGVIAAINTVKEIVHSHILTAKEMGLDKIRIYHDYQGISSWVDGSWQTNKTATKAYKEFVQNSGLDISFTKVAAHTGNEGNEIADIIAKYSVGLIDFEKQGRKLEKIPHFEDLGVDFYTLDLE